MSIFTAVVRSSKVLTIAGAVASADTVTIGGSVYTWKTAVSSTSCEVKIGGSVGASGDNLAAAINAGAGSGTVYGSLTGANQWVTAASDGIGGVTVRARTPGAQGNFITISESGAQTAWAGGATVLSGGSGSTGVMVSEAVTEVQRIIDANQVNSEVITELTAVKTELVASAAS